MPFAGHVPFSLTPAEASRAGQRSIEHMTLVLESCIPGAMEQAAAARGGDQVGSTVDDWLASALSNYDAESCRKLFSEFVANGTWHVPTLVTTRGAFFVDDDSFTQDPRLIYVLPWIRSRWDEYKQSLKSAEVVAGRRVFDKWIAVTGEMYRAGVGLPAGTDASDEPWVFAGSSVHDELGLLVQAGLTPLAALQTATINPAKYLGTTKVSGTITAGRIADLVLLDADPLVSIANTRRIHALVLRGRFLL